MEMSVFIFRWIVEAHCVWWDGMMTYVNDVLLNLR